MKTYDVAVIGSGLIGMASAYELQKAGYRVALVDQAGLSAGASAANTGLLLFEGSTDSMMFSLCAKGIELYAGMQEQLGIDIGFSPIQMLSYFQYEEEILPGKEQMELYHKSGFPCELLDAQQVHCAEPELCMDGIIGGLLFQQWKMDPLRVLYGYFLRARGLGMEWYPYHRVVGFRHNGGIIQSIQTTQGELYAGQYLIAAGAWSRELMKNLDIHIPEFYIQGAAIVAERVNAGPRNVICHYEPTRVKMERHSSKLAMEYGWGNFPRQDNCEFIILRDSHNNLISAQRSMVQKEMVTAVPPDFLRDMAQNVVRHFPVLEYCRIVRSWICPVPFVPDEKPFYGYVEPYRNLFISSGFSSVLIMAPIIGQLTKELLSGNKIPYDFRSFDPLRFETRRA